jgi:DNA-binding transcriptional MerR regulator
MPTTLATKQAAIKLQVSPNTLRNWSDQYSTYLGESARPGYQPERQFTDKDLTVLTYIKQLRAEGMKEDSIKLRLAETKFTAIEILQTDINRLQQDTTFTAIQNAPDAPGASPASIVVLDAIATMQSDIAALKASSQTHAPKQGEWFSGFGFGFVAALLFVLLLLALFALRNYL